MTTPILRGTHLQPYRGRQGPIKNGSFVDSLPVEVCLKILSNLNLASTVAVYSTCKSWNKFAYNHYLLNHRIYEKFAFGNTHWSTYFGKEILIDSKDIDTEIRKLPAKEFFQSCQRVNKIFNKVRAEDCLMLVWIPNALTLNKLVALTKTFFSSDNHVHIEPAILQQLGDLKIKKSHWLIMTKDVLPESLNKNYNSQHQIINDWNQKIGARYCIPKIIEIAICYFVQTIDSRISPSNNSTDWYAMGSEDFGRDKIAIAIHPQNKSIHFRTISTLSDLEFYNAGITPCRRF